MKHISMTELRTRSKELVEALRSGEEVQLIHRSQVVGVIKPVGEGEAELQKSGSKQQKVARKNWDRVYAAGSKYLDSQPLAFVEEIKSCLQRFALDEAEGVYVGCGNGRNYIPLVDSGLNLLGLDISGKALAQLAKRYPAAADKLVRSDFESYQPDHLMGYVVSIQVFQHGDWKIVQQLFDKSRLMIKQGGLLCLRVKSSQMPVKDGHYVVEQTGLGGFTVHFNEGKKVGLDIHYYTIEELQWLTEGGFEEVVSPHVVEEVDEDGRIVRSHIEAIWRRL